MQVRRLQMGKSTITLQVQNFDSLMRQVQQLKDGGKKAIKNTVNDMKARAPGWISDEVRKQYNIKKSEIMPAKKGEGGKAANIRVSGETIETMTLIYTGKPLTPLHFSMTPKRPAALTDKKRAIPGEGVNAKGGAALNVAMARVRKKYSITLQIKKGKGTATRKVRNATFYCSGSQWIGNDDPVPEVTCWKIPGHSHPHALSAADDRQ